MKIVVWALPAKAGDFTVNKNNQPTAAACRLFFRKKVVAKTTK